MLVVLDLEKLRDNVGLLQGGKQSRSYGREIEGENEDDDEEEYKDKRRRMGFHFLLGLL